MHTCVYTRIYLHRSKIYAYIHSKNAMHTHGLVHVTHTQDVDDNAHTYAHNRCQYAIEARDEAGVVRFCKLMTSLNMASEGAARFAQFMGKKVQQGAEDVVDKLRQRMSMGMKVSVLGCGYEGECLRLCMSMSMKVSVLGCVCQLVGMKVIDNVSLV